MLHTHLIYMLLLPERQKGQAWELSFRKIGQHWIHKYFHFFQDLRSGFGDRLCMRAEGTDWRGVVYTKRSYVPLQSVPRNMQPESQTRINTETSTQESAARPPPPATLLPQQGPFRHLSNRSEHVHSLP
jgi:hypothetical protein